ncbi:hypothetical protein SISNIDRAFT_465722 [Sistotremastrum niveocremeum HHB9708]|uniref:Uncharacterized protein n=1 Tax=Sistotremastrum niveocremeum HHB9708 TaxID=1314777 RepID=A0A164VJM7_9AGAM|nr:hypothetical protein SISNIDRAFT_465722 [Sistotremastrum niveocremeum HHB9708]
MWNKARRRNEALAGKGATQTEYHGSKKLELATFADSDDQSRAHPSGNGGLDNMFLNGNLGEEETQERRDSWGQGVCDHQEELAARALVTAAEMHEKTIWPVNGSARDTGSGNRKSARATAMALGVMKKEKKGVNERKGGLLDRERTDGGLDTSTRGLNTSAQTKHKNGGLDTSTEGWTPLS